MAGVLVEVGRFCPNPSCPDYGRMDQGNMIHYGHNPKLEDSGIVALLRSTGFGSAMPVPWFSGCSL